MNAQIATLLKQQGKNITLLIVCGSIVSVVVPTAADTIMSAVCLAVGAPVAVQKWAERKTAKERADETAQTVT